MSWFADLAGKAENLLVNIDEQTGAALRNQNLLKPKRGERSDNPPAEPGWAQKRRPMPRTLRNVPSSRKTGFSTQAPPAPQPAPPKELLPIKSPRHKTLSPGKKGTFNLNNCPKTMVGELKELDTEVESYGYKPRRFSLPANLSSECLNYRLENMEVENAMLKNELNVTNREIKELLERLHRTEDELSKTNKKFENMQSEYRKILADKEGLESQLEQYKTQLANLTNVELRKYRERQRDLDSELANLRDKNKDLEELCRLLNMTVKEKESNQNKAETDLRHAHSAINTLQSDLEKSKDECKRLEKEWESYKHRVKSMLAAKDKEISTMQQGTTLTEDTKALIDQVDSLKKERELLSEAVTRVRSECDDMKKYMETLETRHNASERIVMALRDALKDERAARVRAESQCNALNKELKTIQIESSQTIANLRNVLREKELEVAQCRESATTVRTTDSSALNVGDYSRECDDDDKVYYLTQKLVQKQARIDMLLADNNILKIQLEKSENKHKSETSARSNSQSVVHFQDGVVRARMDQCPPKAYGFMFRWFTMLFRRYRIFRAFLFVYIVCLHFWVLTILFASTPDNTNRNYPYGYDTLLPKK